MRGLLILAMALGCSGSDQAKARREAAHRMEEMFRKGGESIRISTRGDDDTTLVIDGPTCTKRDLEQIDAANGRDFRSVGFVTIECVAPGGAREARKLSP